MAEYLDFGLFVQNKGVSGEHWQDPVLGKKMILLERGCKTPLKHRRGSLCTSDGELGKMLLKRR